MLLRGSEWIWNVVSPSENFVDILQGSFPKCFAKLRLLFRVSRCCPFDAVEFSIHCLFDGCKVAPLVALEWFKKG